MGMTWSGCATTAICTPLLNSTSRAKKFAIIFGFVFLIRLFGAWMLRINDVVNELEKVNRKLTNIEKKLDKDSE